MGNLCESLKETIRPFYQNPIPNPDKPEPNRYLYDGPSAANTYVGYSSVGTLAAGATKWVSFNWKIPTAYKPGDYKYSAKTFCGDYWFGAQAFRIVAPVVGCSAQVTSLWTVGNITCGSKATLWARVQNTGSSALPSTAKAWFWVSGPSGPNYYVGSADVGGLAAGATKWVSYQWTVPTNYQSGTYSYRARVWDHGTGLWCGDWKEWQTFGVTCGACTSFNEQFSGGTAPMWNRDKGSWYVVSNAYYYTPGLSGLVSTSTYNQECRNFDFRARLWRYGSESNNANRLIVRASGSVGTDGVHQNGYLFQYTRGGSFSVYKRVNGVFTALKSWTSSSAVRQGDNWNDLRVYAYGTQFYFYINNTLVWTGSDSSLSSGREGVGMYRSSGSTGNGFWVDWATLTALSGDADMPADTVSEEQQQLNDLADKNPIGNENSAE